MSEFERIADQDHSRAIGQEHPEHAWICSDRDVWYPNPAYQGPRQPHPEDDDAGDYIAEHGIEAWREMTSAFESGNHRSFNPSFGIPTSEDSEIPF